MAKTKVRQKTLDQSQPRVGDHAWQVCWIAGIPMLEGGESDIDNADRREETFYLKSDADRRAKEVFPLCGVVEIYEVDFVPYEARDARQYPWAGYWEERGLPEQIESVEQVAR